MYKNSYINLLIFLKGGTLITDKNLTKETASVSSVSDDKIASLITQFNYEELLNFYNSLPNNIKNKLNLYADKKIKLDESIELEELEERRLKLIEIIPSNILDFPYMIDPKDKLPLSIKRILLKITSEQFNIIISLFDEYMQNISKKIKGGYAEHFHCTYLLDFWQNFSNLCEIYFKDRTSADRFTQFDFFINLLPILIIIMIILVAKQGERDREELKKFRVFKRD